MTSASEPTASWAERAAERSLLVQRSRNRSARQVQLMVNAAQRLWAEQSGAFTTQELVKEAGVALQTFYRHFEGKDQLLLAAIEDLLSEQIRSFEEAALDIADPVARLRSYITAALRGLERGRDDKAGGRLMTAEHWRLQELFPEEMAQANQPFRDLVCRELKAAAEAGQLTPTDPECDAWMIQMVVMSVYHHHALAPSEVHVDDVVEHVWKFCLTAVGGQPGSGEEPHAQEEERAKR